MRTRRLEGERRLDWGAAAGGFTPADLTGFVEAWIGEDLPAAATAATWPGMTGTHTLSQGTGASCPQIATDTGKRYALFDGSDDFILKDPYTQGSTAGHSVFMAIRMTADGSFPMLFVTNNGARELRCSGATRILEQIVNTGGGSVGDPAGELVVGTDYVVGVTINFTTNAVSLYIDGVAVNTGTDSTDPSATQSVALSIGARTTGSNPSPMRVYGAVYCEAGLSAAEVASVTSYLQALLP